MTKKAIVIATTKSWNKKNALIFQERFEKEYDTYIFTDKNQLTYEALKAIQPRYCFFPHWSWIIPKNIYIDFDCIVFHMTDLPYGRGGSPLQNLIIRKNYETKISALKVDSGIDSGKIYMKIPFYVGIGNAEEILLKASQAIFFEMIPKILLTKPIPRKQAGQMVIFKRRKPDDSDLGSANLVSLDDWYDFVRMLDGEGYPNAYLKVGRFKVTFKNVRRGSANIAGTFEVEEDEE